LLRLLKANSDKAVSELPNPTGYLDLVVKLKELVNFAYVSGEAHPPQILSEVTELDPEKSAEFLEKIRNRNESKITLANGSTINLISGSDTGEEGRGLTPFEFNN